ncbi:MAG TPA: hypothetical protein VFA26_17735 [Gemmataceae bacterium]|nr:hypothetical protein [Gemmataceae bacterium]
MAGRVGFPVPLGRAATMRQLVEVNPTSEHALYLRLFVTIGGGW